MYDEEIDVLRACIILWLCDNRFHQRHVVYIDIERKETLVLLSKSANLSTETLLVYNPDFNFVFVFV